jgi:dUTP pyrophosphatase
MMLKLKIHKLYDDVILPSFSTRGAACFDIHAYYKPELGYKVWNDDRKKFIDRKDSSITIHPFQRVLIPTGMILDIPPGHSVRIHPRSGTAIKQGLSLINCEGVIDYDYVEPLFIACINLSDIQTVVINNGDRIAQGELVRELQYDIDETSTKPLQKTDRDGGFGSTGK